MSGIQEYSTTPGSNTAINSINVAENCPASGINNAIRQHMADDRDQWNNAEWWQYGDGDGSATVSYVSSTSFKIVGADVSSVWHAGRRVKLVAATPGTIYGTIASVAYVTDTTVTVTWDSGSLSNEAITSAFLGIISASNQSLPVSSSTAKGAVELATTTEQITGTDATRAATPDSIAALWEKGSDIASATTISIGEGGFFHVTGTTAITDIDFATDKAGRAAWLIFDGALTLTHNATTLILPTGANITTAAGDAAFVVSEDGSDNVRVPIYARKSGAALTATTYPITLSYTSSDTAITASSTQTFAHSLGTTPKIVQVYLVAGSSAEHNYSTGDVIALGSVPGDVSSYGVQVMIDSTNVSLIVASTVGLALDKTTRAQFTISSSANVWKFRVVAYA